ncbi:MAG TPA: CoA pyrophosphatase [Gammaproteobacteria bacterium]|nr:CoA pyrophosphatase [Pseudomonadota bacterium]HAY44714.1 CoA pyrophosphatase [Gammaproteobacteria bacterium]
MEHVLQPILEYPATLGSLDGARYASVALIFQQTRSALELLVIKRATREGDPWSGQMAFPGGKIDSTDKDARSAAEREVLEEVGFTLSKSAYVGRLDDTVARVPDIPSVVLSAFVYLVPSPVLLDLNEEVAEALWVPLSRFTDPSYSADFQHPRMSNSLMPAVRLSDSDQHIFWGLSYRVMEAFWKAAGEV